MINLTRFILVCVLPYIDTLTKIQAHQLFEPLEPEAQQEIENNDSLLTGKIKRDKRNILKSIMNV